MTTETKPETRAQLLERCRAAGFKATGWDKGRMERELDALARLVSGDPTATRASIREGAEAEIAAALDNEPAPKPAVAVRRKLQLWGVPPEGGARRPVGEPGTSSDLTGLSRGLHNEGWREMAIVGEDEL